MEKVTLTVHGMSCAHCEKAVVNGLEDLGASDITASAKANTVEFSHDPVALPLEKIKAEILDMGYQCA